MLTEKTTFLKGVEAKLTPVNGQISRYSFGEGATVITTMIHSWGPNVTVYPRAAAHINKGGRFISNYVVMSPVKHTQMAPEAVVEEGGKIALGVVQSRGIGGDDLAK